MSVVHRSAAALVCILAGCTSVQQHPGAKPTAAARTLPATRELAPAEQITHVLSRLTFGARPGDAERVAAIGVDRWIAEQLRPESIADSAVVVALASNPSWSQPASASANAMPTATAALAPFTTTVRMAMQTDGAAKPLPLDSIAKRVSFVRSLVLGNDLFLSGKIIRAQLSERQLLEVIADFWENHFSVYANKMPSREALVVWDRDVLRPRALGKFRDLLGAVAHSPAMLFYLDNQLSAKGGINENYARELLELHTLGVDGGYTQQDVIEVARALTGWTLNRAPSTLATTTASEFSFKAAMHDSAKKVVLGHTLAAGRGIEDGEEVLDLLARHPSTARFIASKLARRLVSDTPSAALVERAAATFTATDGDIAEVVRTIVTSPEFFSRAAFRAKVKTPFEFVVSARRALNAPADSTPATVRLLTQLGQAMFGRLTPEGWPEYGGAWVNAGAIRQRMKVGADVAAGAPPFAPVERWDAWTLLSKSPVDEQVDGVVRLLLGGVAAPATRKVLVATPGDAEPRLRQLVAVVIGSPEFQRR